MWCVCLPQAVVSASCVGPLITGAGDNYSLLRSQGQSPSPGATSSEVAQLTHVEVSMQVLYVHCVHTYKLHLQVHAWALVYIYLYMCVEVHVHVHM